MSPAGKWTSIGVPVSLALVFSAATVVSAATTAEIDDARQFREDFGFDASPSVLTASYADKAKYVDESWGVPLTAAEAKEMDRRTDERQAIRPAIEFARHLDGWAEMYLDQHDGAKPIFFFTKDIEARRTAIAKRMPQGVDFGVRKVDFSSSELRAKQNNVTEAMETDGWELAGGIRVAQVADGVKRNRVMVGLLKSSDLSAAREIVRNRFGPMVDVEYVGPSENDACTGRDNCRNPLKGGTRMGRNGQFKCTMGFNASRNGTPVMLTAGHCFTENGGTSCSGSEVKWNHNGSPIGCAWGESLPSGGGMADNDIGWVKIDGNDDGTPRNKVFKYTNTHIYIKDVLGGSDLSIDDALCRSGGKSNWDCGKLKAKCVDKPNGEGWTIRCTATINKDSQGGDSGAPVVRRKSGGGDLEYEAAGIHVHSSEGYNQCSVCRSWFTKATRAEDESSSSICTTSSC